MSRLPGGLQASPDPTASVNRRRRSWSTTVLLGLLTVASGGLLVALGAAIGAGRNGLAVGKPAPPFELSTYDGETIRLAELRGSVVVLNFWASWCRTCPLEAQELEALWQDYRSRGVWVIGVAYVDTPGAARAYLQRHGISYPNGPDRGGRLSRLYRVTGVPETLVLDSLGRVVPLPVVGAAPPGAARLIGPLGEAGPLSATALRRVIDSLLAGEGGS